MNKLIAIITILLMSAVTSAQTPFKGSDYIYYYQVGIGKTNGSLTNSASWLEIGKDSTTKAMRMPRVVDTANVAAPVFGLEVYQIKDNKRYYRDKYGWRQMADNTILGNYLLKSDSTIYYPYWSNPRGYLSTETDPIANAKTVRWIAGTGINVSNGTAQALSTNPVATISAQNTIALWNASQIQGINVSSTAPTSGQFLSFNGTQYVPINPPPSGTVTSVGLSMPGIFSVTGSPVTASGTLSANFNSQLANLVFASPNGTSGTPIFRSLAYPDLPISGVSASSYGNDTVSSRFTVNDRGVITSAGSSNLSSFFIRNQGSYEQTANFFISGFGTLNKIFTNAGTGSASQSHITMRTANSSRITIGLTGLESTSNVGSDFIISRYDDSGIFLGNLLYGQRSNGFVGVGTTSPTNKLTIQAGNTYSDGFATSIVNKPINNVASHTNETVLNVTVNGVVQSIPSATPGNFGKIYTITKDFPGGRAYVSSNSIDGLATYPLGDTIKGITIISDGAAWKVISTKNVLTVSGGAAVASLKEFYTDAGNTSTSIGIDNDLYVYSVPANTLSNIGDKLIVEYAGVFAANNNSKSLGTGFGIHLNTGSNTVTINDGGWAVKMTIIRNGATKVRIKTEIPGINPVTAEYDPVDFTIANNLVLRGAGGGAINDVVAKMGYIEFHKAAP